MDAATTSGRAVDCDPVPVRDEGYVDALVRASLHLIRKDFPHEVRGHGVRLLQHLMRFRWEEVSIINWSKFADVFSLLGVELGVLDDLVWKNAAADLVAEVVWSHGISLLHDLIPCLVCLSAKRATETELVCFILKSISDNRIAHVSHFGVQLTGKLTPLVLIGDKGELLSLSEFLPQILPFISSLLEKHVGAVLGEKEKCQVEVAEEHASVVKAVLDAAITYAGWAHVVDLGKHGLIKGCGCLLSCNDFCVHALQFFKLILQRKRPVSIAVADHDFADYLLCPHTTFHYVQALHGALSISASPKDYCSSSSSYSNISGTVSQNTSVQKRLSCESSSNNKSSTAVVMSSPDSCITLSTQVEGNDCELDLQGNDGARRSNSFHHVGCLLLAEQNLISEAFLIVSSWSRIQQYKEVLTCILSPLSKIWTQPEWESKYTHYAWCLTCLFSNRQFVKNVHDVVKSWEGQLKRRAEESHAIQMPDKYSVSLLGLILPLLLRYLQCVHALWNREITFDLSKKLAKAKRFGIDEEEGFQEIEMRQWLQDIRESGYLLLNDCLGRLRMSLFGYLVDGEAATKAIPFCRALIHLAGAANDDKLRDLVKEQKEIEDAADSFTCWLVKQKEDLHAKACSAPPKEFFGQTQLEWNWELEDEFRRYLPVYFDTMQEVDAMVDCLEVDFFDLEVLYKNLRPEFRSKYAIDSSKHPHLRIMSNMRERKYYSMISAKHHKQICEILGELITLKPYIKGSDHYYEIVERIGEKIEIPSRIFDRDDAKKSIRVLLQILHFWEPQFHPLIREGHKDFLLDIARRLAKAKATEYSEVRDEGYVDALVRASLHFIRKDFPHEVRGHGVRLLQHLMRFRWEEVVWSHGISLLHDLIPCLVCLSAKGATERQVEVAEEHASVVKAVLDAANAYARWAHVIDLGMHGLIKGYAINKVETGKRPVAIAVADHDFADYLFCPHTTFHYVPALQGALSISANPKDTSSSSSSRYSNSSGTIFQKTSVQKRLSSGSSSSSKNKRSTAVGNDGARRANSFHHLGCLLLAEHNIISEAFLTASSWSRCVIMIQRYKEVLVYSVLLAKFEPSQSGKANTHIMHGASHFVKNVHDVAKTWEGQLKRRAEESHAIQMPDKYSAKRLGIDEEEGFQEIEMRQWLQDIREIGKCIKLQQAHKGKICTWNWEFEDEFEDIFQFETCSHIFYGYPYTREVWGLQSQNQANPNPNRLLSASSRRRLPHEAADA
uniref:Exportin-5 C-terminal domain-containing protein n=1 Tax=Oryza rufipogon TaxID=4529 RepID=A0A0E0R8Y9_ORYRU